MSPEEHGEVFEQFSKFLAAEVLHATGATCQGLAKYEVTEEEPSVEDAEDWGKEVIRRIRTSWPRILLERGENSPLTLENRLAEPPFSILESPFDVLDETLTDEEKVRKVVDYIRDESKIQFAEELAARLTLLYEAAKDEDPDEVPISAESLSNFVGFLQETPNLRYPDVVLTPSKEIRAQWRRGPNRHFAVVFLPTGETRYVIFTPNVRDPDKIDRLSGITSVDTLMETAQPHRVLDWAS